jgi:hypothetical protein
LQPNVLELQNGFEEIADNVLLKLSPLLDVSDTLRYFKNVSEVHIIAINNECKELLLVLNYKQKVSEVRYFATDLSDGKDLQFIDNDRDKNCEYSYPLKYLYEPNAALMKLAFWGEIGVRFGMKQLHRNTHLFTSDESVDDFLGRRFQIENIVPYNRNAVSVALNGQNKANVSVRNFPDSADVVKRKLHLKDGGDVYLFAVTLQNDKPSILITRKLLTI